MLASPVLAVWSGWAAAVASGALGYFALGLPTALVSLRRASIVLESASEELLADKTFALGVRR